MIAVSACLAGKRCRYDGRSNSVCEIVELVNSGKAICVCPELLGGMSTPRLPCELDGSAADVLDGRARVVDSVGGDMTAFYVAGAEETLRICRENGITEVVLKARSPSCGCGCVYDGTFSSRLTDGNGVTAELLVRNGLSVISR